MSDSGNLRRIFRQWGGTTASFFTYTHFSHDLCTGLLFALLPLIREGLGLSYLQSGLLISAFTITSGFSQLPMGWIGDRVSRRILVAIGLAGVSVAGIAVGLSTAYSPMLFILIVMGIFAGAYHPSATSMLFTYFEPERRGSVLGLHGVGGTFGFIIAPVLGGLIASVLGWRSAFVILSIPALVIVPLVLKKFRLPEQLGNIELLRQRSDDNNVPVKAVSRLSILGKSLRPVAVATTLTIFVQLVAGCFMVFLPLYLVDKHGIPAAYAAMWLGVIRGGGVVGSLLGGWLSDRWNRKTVLYLAISASGPVLYLLTILPFNTALIVTFVLLGLVMFMRQPTIQSLILDVTPSYLRATVIGIYFFLGMEGVSLIQPIAGQLMDIWGIVQVYKVIAISSIALSIVALVLLIRQKSRR